MKNLSVYMLLVSFTCFFSLVSCEEPEMPPAPVYPNGAIIGANGPEAMRGWDSVTIPGRFCFGDYYNTGGAWYASLEIDTLLYTEYTQLYLNRNVPELGNAGWYLEGNFSVSDRFLYLPDPERVYFAWDYVVIIYLEYWEE